MRRGDTVITSGGFVGKVTKAADNSDEVEVELADNMRVRVLKSTLMDVRAKGETGQRGNLKPPIQPNSDATPRRDRSSRCCTSTAGKSS